MNQHICDTRFIELNDSGFGIPDFGFGIWDLGFGIWDLILWFLRPIKMLKDHPSKKKAKYKNKDAQVSHPVVMKNTPGLFRDYYGPGK